MEELLRTYYTNLNPSATEEEILAFLQSQGIDMSAPVSQGITSLAPNYMPESSDNTNVFRPDLPVGQKAPGGLMTFLTTLFAPPVGIAMQLQRMADKNQLPGNLNNFFGSRASANVEQGLPAVINMQSVYDDFGYGDSGPSGSYDGATSMSEYSADPTSFSGSF